MNYIEFRKSFFDKLCFSTNLIKAGYPHFNTNNLTRWVKKGLLVKLRNGYYAFPGYLTNADSALYIANRIYRPSYISLHTALAFYNIIPEAVVQITCVSTLKTMEFVNRFGTFSYKKIVPSLMFGYEQKPFLNSKTILIAQPEKALLDLLYLYPFYNSIDEIVSLRLDEQILLEIIDIDKLNDYADSYKNKAFSKRVKLLKEVYRLC